MAVYRYQVVSVGLWRGQIKRWNTTFHYQDSSHTSTLWNHMNNACYPNPGDATGACSGGIASISVYNAAGGAPVSQTTYFDWETTTEWIPFGGSSWSGIGASVPVDASGESAALIVGTMPGLSSTGKPITTRKYIHAVPSREAAAYDDPDITSANQTALADTFPAEWMGNAAGVTPTDVSCEAYYFNHQRTRGRRRTTKQVASQSFSAGVVAGAGATASGDQPFP